MEQDGTFCADGGEEEHEGAARLRRSEDSEGHSDRTSEAALNTRRSTSEEDGGPFYHELKRNENKEKDSRGGSEPQQEQKQQEEKQREADRKRAFRKELNREARGFAAGSIHDKVKIVVHRHEVTEECRKEYHRLSAELAPIIRELVRRVKPVLEHETAVEFAGSKLYGSRFTAEKVAAGDFRYFARKRPPEETPSLAVALRIDESASMEAFGRLEAAKRSAAAVCEFCQQCGIPLLICGDTADRSRLEQMSIYSYIDFDEKEPDNKYSLMSMRGRSNNRDGLALRILAEKLLRTPQQTKLLISLSDGRPKAAPDYTGEKAEDDMKQTIREFEAKGILFLAAAIGQDKDVICDMYGNSRYIDSTDLNKLPARLVTIISRYL